MHIVCGKAGMLFVGLVLTAGMSGEEAQPVNRLSDEGFIRDWTVIGPFPNALSSETLPDGSTRSGYYTNYLASLGDEGEVALTPGTAINFTDDNGCERAATARNIKARGDGYVDLRKTFDTGDRVAYAFCYIEAAEAQTVLCAFGSNDSAKVWLNGEQMHRFWSPDGRGCKRWSDEFEMPLRTGRNALLVKVEDFGGYAWEFVVELYPPDAPVIQQRQRREELIAFQDCLIVPEDRWGFMFPPGDLPKLKWDNPDAVAQATGEFPLEVRWFDADLNEVTEAEKPGRYAAVLDTMTPKGIRVRRAVTFYCRPDDWRPWSGGVKANLEFDKPSPVAPSALKERRELLASWLGGSLTEWMFTDEAGASLMASLAEMEPLGRAPSPMNRPDIMTSDYHVALRRKLAGLDNESVKLKPPRRIDGTPAPVLRTGTLAEAGIKPGTVEKVRAICERWYAESQEPFTVLLARHGVIFMHEAFTGNSHAEIRLDTPMNTASLTKMLSGLMFAQFVDQGLMGIDAPIGTVLCDFPVEGDKVITFRNCFTHSTSLTGHGSWGGLQNPYLDNVIANGIGYLEPGRVYQYNGDGLNLAGKAMELVGGRPVLRLIYEHLFQPLGITDFGLNDLGGGAILTTEDIARIAQMLLNRGAYGEYRFFSPETFEALLPRPLCDFYPGLEAEEGIAIRWMRTLPWLAKEMGVEPDEAGLSQNTIGYTSASGATLQVDLDNDLVVSQARNAQGPLFEEHRFRFRQAIADGLME
jgi:CubicO group peptidase (beta-lactamase class C family)